MLTLTCASADGTSYEQPGLSLITEICTPSVLNLFQHNLMQGCIVPSHAFQTLLWSSDLQRLDADGGLVADLEDPVPNFSFRGRVQYYDRAQIDEIVQQACRGMEPGHHLARAMQRGIGVHHGGLPTRYRQNVEILFRCKYLQCIIATGGHHSLLCRLHGNM